MTEENKELAVATTDSERIIMSAIKEKVPVETLERLLAMRKEMRADDARDQFFRALSLFQSKCPVIPKDRVAGSVGFTYRYAPLETIVKHIGPLLNDCGLSFTFDTIDSENDKTTICTVHHIAGHSETSSFRVPIDKQAKMNDTQKQGSAGTYAKRYALCNALGILTGEEDDDAAGSGLGAAGHHPSPPAEKKPEETKKAKEPTKMNNGTLSIVGVITNITEAKTKTGGIRHRIVLDGEEKIGYYTFDQKIADEAHRISSDKVFINFKKGGFGNDIISIRVSS